VVAGSRPGRPDCRAGTAGHLADWPGSFITYLETLPRLTALDSNLNSQSILLLVQDLSALLLGTVLPADQVQAVARMSGIAVVVVSALLNAVRLPLRWAISLMVCLTIVASPIAWSHYLVLTLIPLGCIARWLIDHRFPVRQTNLALAVAVLLLLSWPVWNYLALLACGYADEPPGTNGRLCPVARAPAGTGAKRLACWLVVELGRRGRV
jgi:hypothetical protein